MNKIERYFRINFSDLYQLIDDFLKYEEDISVKERKKIIQRISNTRDIRLIIKTFCQIDDLSDKEICVLLNNGKIFDENIDYHYCNRFLKVFNNYLKCSVPIDLEDDLVRFVVQKIEIGGSLEDFLILGLRNKIQEENNKLKLTKAYIKFVKRNFDENIYASSLSCYLSQIIEPTNDEIDELRKEMLESNFKGDLICSLDYKIPTDVIYDVINRLFEFKNKAAPLELIGRGKLNSIYYSKIINRVYELTKDKNKINGNNLIFSIKNLSDAKDVSKVLSMVLKFCSSIQIYSFIIKNIKILTKEQIGELILKICDEENFEYIKKLSTRINLLDYMDDIIKSIKDSDKIEYKYWILKEYGQHVKKEDFDKMTNDIILSRNMKYICLTAIYIQPSVLIKIFGGFNNLFTYVMKSNLFDKDEKIVLANYMSNIICDSDPDMINSSVENNLNNVIKKYVYVSEIKKQN